MVDTIGEYWVSEIRLPYSPGYPELRPKPNTTGLGTPREAFCAVKQGRFLVQLGEMQTETVARYGKGDHTHPFHCAPKGKSLVLC